MKCVICSNVIGCGDRITDYLSRVCHWDCLIGYTKGIEEYENYYYCVWVMFVRHGGCFNGYVPKKAPFDYERILVINKRTDNFGGHYKKFNGSVEVSDEGTDFMCTYKAKIEDFCKRVRRRLSVYGL